MLNMYEPEYKLGKVAFPTTLHFYIFTSMKLLFGFTHGRWSNFEWYLVFCSYQLNFYKLRKEG